MTTPVELLEQTRVWRDRDGRTYYLGELDDVTLRGALAHLERHATRLAEHRRRASVAPPALDDASALDWLRGRPLYRALTAEARRRDVGSAVVVDDTEVDRRRLERLAGLLRGYHDVIVRLERIS